MRRYPTISMLFEAPWLFLSPALGADTAPIDNSASEAASTATDKMSGSSPTPTPGRAAGQETSDRTPKKDTSTPLSQTTKVEGETSDRTPGN